MAIPNIVDEIWDPDIARIETLLRRYGWRIYPDRTWRTASGHIFSDEEIVIAMRHGEEKFVENYIKICGDGEVGFPSNPYFA